MENTGISQQGQNMLASPAQTPRSMAGAGAGNMGETTIMKSKDLAQIITDITKDNLARVQGLLYFCGGEARYGKDPEHTRGISASQWVEDLEARTKFNFTDEGKIELAKQYTVGTAIKVIMTVLQQGGYSWVAVKAKIVEVFPEEKDFANYRYELSNARRLPGETITEFYVRTDSLMQNLIKMDPGCIVYVKQDQVAAFRKALLPAFDSCLHGPKKKEPAEVYNHALHFVRNDPRCKLSDSNLRKEVKQSVNMTLSADLQPTKMRQVEKKHL